MSLKEYWFPTTSQKPTSGGPEGERGLSGPGNHVEVVRGTVEDGEGRTQGSCVR